MTPPDGTLTGATFMSDPIPDTLGFSFVVDDANGCDPQTVAQTEVDCSCTTTVGMMTSAPMPISMPLPTPEPRVRGSRRVRTCHRRHEPNALDAARPLDESNARGLDVGEALAFGCEMASG